MQKIEGVIFLSILILTIPIFFLNNFETSNLKEKKKKSSPSFFLVIFFYLLYINTATLVALTEKIYENGIVFLVIFLGIGYSKIIFAKYFTSHLSKFYNCKSAGDILSINYGKFGKLSCGGASFLSYLGDLSCQILVIGKLLEFFLITPESCGAIIAAILIFVATFFKNKFSSNILSKICALLFLGVLLLTLNLFFAKLNLREILQSMNTQNDFIERWYQKIGQVVKDKNCYT